MAYSRLTKVSISTALFCAVGASHALAKLTPARLTTDERLWTKDKAAEVRGAVRLTADREVRGLHIYEPDIWNSTIYLNDHQLAVGAEGIHMNSFEAGTIEGTGRLTSIDSMLRFYLNIPGEHVLGVSSRLSDNGTSKVNINISGAHGDGSWGLLAFTGAESNTFTGDLTISGHNNLSLHKDGGALAILGNVYVREGARLSILKDSQISKASKVSLVGAVNQVSNLSFSNDLSEDISQKLHSLQVTGEGMLSFERPDDSFEKHGQRHLYLDDLEITKGSNLLVRFWAEGRDHLLVRRDSEHLLESLKRIQFEGYDPNAIHLADYDKDYWEINAMPEPATYGAGLMLGVLGFIRYRRFQKRRCPKQRPLAVG